jgi:hypothetical protein
LDRFPKGEGASLKHLKHFLRRETMGTCKRSVLLKTKSAGLFLPVLAAVFILFCVSPVYSASTQTGVIANVAPDWSSSAISTVSVDPEEGPRKILNNQLPSATSDITVDAFGKYYYRLGRFQADNITKVDANAPNTPIWQYTTNDSGESDSNPYDLVFVSSTKAYLLRYGATKAWIVNPSTTTQGGFKIGDLDLKAYADGDGLPEMAKGVIANGKLFIIMQRLDEDYYFCPSNTPYVAVFDVETDTEIVTGKGEGSKKGIPLPIKNPLTIQYVPENNKIYVQGIGSYPGNCDPQYDYTGGIASIDPQTYVTEMVVDDGSAKVHPYGSISGMLISSPAKGYFVGYDGWGDNTLYPFNPTTGAVGAALEDFKNVSIAGMESGTYLDKNAMMWVCNQTDGTVDIVDTTDNSLNESLDTNLNPQAVAFCTTGPPLAPTLGSTMVGGTVSFHWNTVSGADGYYLLGATPQNGGISGMYDWGTGTSVSASLPAEMALYVAIIPYNAEGAGDSSIVLRADNAGLLPAPVLSSTMVGNMFTYEWDAVPGADGYYLLGATPQSGGISGIYDWGTVRSASVSLPAGMTLYVSIIPYNAEGAGTASNVIRAE